MRTASALRACLSVTRPPDQAGTVSISRDGGEARTCDYDLHSVRDPDTMTNHITGTICDREIDITKEWNWDRTG